MAVSAAVPCLLPCRQGFSATIFVRIYAAGNTITITKPEHQSIKLADHTQLGGLSVAPSIPGLRDVVGRTSDQMVCVDWAILAFNYKARALFKAIFLKSMG
jgi:hypothetical protein